MTNKTYCKIPKGKHIKIELSAEVDDMPLEGHFDYDGCEETIADINERLEFGEVWAWACVEVRATCEISGLSESAYLGACSYKDTADFIKCGDYYQDMVEEAKGFLDEARETMAKDLCEVV